MKLYTEEQVWQMYNLYDTNLDQDGCCIIDEYKHFDQCIRTLIPIELPSDEELERHIVFIEWDDKLSFKKGTLWMKEQILNQKKS